MTSGRLKITLDDLPDKWQVKMMELSAQGYGDIHLRNKCLGHICHETWQRLIDEDPIFSETVRKCRELCQIWWEEIGMKMSDGTQEKGNSSVWALNMNNRFGWRGKQEVAHSGEIDNPSLSREDFKQRLIAVLQSNTPE